MITADQVRRAALALPEAHEAPHFEVTSFRVRQKIFATMGEVAGRIVLKLTPDRQAMMMEVRPDLYSRPENYWGRQGWTYFALAAADVETLRHALATSYRTVAPKKLVAALDAAG